MIESTTSAGTPEMGAILDVKAAIRWAWVGWLIMLVIPFLVFLGVLASPTHEESVREFANPWCITAIIYLLIIVPASFFWRNRLFKSYFSGHPVTPAKYLFGMLSVWLALEIGGVFSLIGCRHSGSLMPNLIPALVAFVFYLTMYPNGRAMIRTVGNSEDPHIYKEPR